MAGWAGALPQSQPAVGLSDPSTQRPERTQLLGETGLGHSRLGAAEQIPQAVALGLNSQRFDHWHKASASTLCISWLNPSVKRQRQFRSYAHAPVQQTSQAIATAATRANEQLLIAEIAAATCQEMNAGWLGQIQTADGNGHPAMLAFQALRLVLMGG